MVPLGELLIPLHIKQAVAVGALLRLAAMALMQAEPHQVLVVVNLQEHTLEVVQAQALVTSIT